MVSVDSPPYYSSVCSACIPIGMNPDYFLALHRKKKKKRYQCTKCLEVSDKKLCKNCNKRSCFDLGYE